METRKTSVETSTGVPKLPPPTKLSLAQGERAKIKRADKPIRVLANGMKVWAYDDSGNAICNALHQNHYSRRCKETDVQFPSGRCSKHQGKRLSGILHPGYVHGKKTRYGDILPQKYVEAFQSLAELKDWMSLKEDIHLIGARLRELVRGLADLPDAVTMNELVDLANLAQAILDRPASTETQANELRRVVKNFITAVESGDRERELFSEIRHNQSHLSKLITTETKRKEVEEHSIPAYDAYVMFQTIVMSIKARVKDPFVLRQIANDIKGLTSVIRLPEQNTSLQLLGEEIDAKKKVVEYDFDAPPEEDEIQEAEYVTEAANSGPDEVSGDPDDPDDLSFLFEEPSYLPEVYVHPED